MLSWQLPLKIFRSMIFLLSFLQALPVHTGQLCLVFYLHCWQWVGTDKVLLSNWLFLQVVSSGFTYCRVHSDLGGTTAACWGCPCGWWSVPCTVRLLLCWPWGSQFLGSSASLRIHVGRWECDAEGNESIQFPFLAAVMLFRLGWRNTWSLENPEELHFYHLTY